MQKIYSMGDERAETPNRGHGSNPEINNSRKPASSTTEGIKGKGKWKLETLLASLPRAGCMKLLAGKEEERPWLSPPHTPLYNSI